MKRIFYCNITYGCNSKCVFCYSHNTKNNSKSHNEISIDEYLEYLVRNNVGEHDRVIVNGGEPLLHSRIQALLNRLGAMNCEVLVYSNGRLLPELNLEKITEKFRFVIPIHGFQELHDEITKTPGSYLETLKGFNYLVCSKCKVDMKVILNYKMVANDENFNKTLESLKNIPFNHAVHITKMANTIISQKNKCASMHNSLSAKYTEKLYDYFKKKCKIKIFDTCVKDLINIDPSEIVQLDTEIKVFFKDFNQESDVLLEKPYMKCMETCEKQIYCHSAVGEYTVLEFNNDIVRIGLE